MTTTRLSTKGQIILPTDVRRRHGWNEGLEFELEERGDSIVLRPVHALPKTTVDDLLGCLPYEGVPKTLDEMDAGIAKGARLRR